MVRQAEIEAWIEDKLPWIHAGLIELLQINTIYDPTTQTDDQPYGEGIAKALEWFEQQARDYGFTTFNDQGQYLMIEHRASQSTDKRIDIVGHVDVVDVGNGWTHDPFGAEIVDNRIYARGAQDMKTADWLSFVALVMVKELNIATTHHLRLVIGTAEETTFEDIAYYVEQQGLPNFMFTPDSAFQVTLGEKGDATFSVEGAIESPTIYSLTTLNSENMVCDRVDIELKEEELPALLAALEQQTFRWTIEETTLTIYGKAAHSSTPEAGENALVHAFHFFAEVVKEDWAVPFANYLSDYHGAGLDLEPYYEPMGTVTVNPSQMKVNDGQLYLITDIRFPNPVTKDDLLNRIQQKFHNYVVENHFHYPPTEVSLDSPYVNVLTQVYDQWIGENQPPYYSGGITYAKLFKGVGVAFGIQYENNGMERLAHQADEYFNLLAIPTTLGALADAIIGLGGLDQ